MPDANGNGIDVKRLSISAQAAVQIAVMAIIAVGSSAASLLIWQGSINARVSALEKAQARISSTHYAFRYPDAWYMLQNAERLNPGWIAPDVYAMPTSSGDPPLFPRVQRAMKQDRDRPQ